MFKVTEVLDINTYRVSPRWTWSGQTSDIVKADKIQTASKDDPLYASRLSKVKTLLVDQTIVLTNPLRVIGDSLFCDVLLNNKNLSEYIS